ncbi:transposase [Bradyrhizobium sp. AUGA SZCCT0158]|uniref:IS110 family transposase n=1 Tax=Bradyrhizobium sp. AUGA SZCCT0158 TaxID=2807661 RepID=UPI001BABC55B|nr:transposase [Bradyrhizobium sp. AUGA SZCCT0158]MBR1195288.1 transposase [Bradyrhizobium sp. AUGA SZCCT0158]
MMAQNDQIVVGIDVAKDKVDACIRTLSQRHAFPNTAQGHRKIIAWLHKHKVSKAVMEASGGYERDWARVLRRAQPSAVLSRSPAAGGPGPRMTVPGSPGGVPGPGGGPGLRREAYRLTGAASNRGTFSRAIFSEGNLCRCRVSTASDDNCVMSRFRYPGRGLNLGQSRHRRFS